MNFKHLFLAALLTASSVGCAQSTAEDTGENEGAASHLDNIGAPTDTGITLALDGKAHRSVLTPTEGWHLLHYSPEKDGYVRIVMTGEKGDATIWSYIRIELEDPTHKKPWLHNTAGVGNRDTNTCEIIMKLEAHQNYKIISTSQLNLTELPNAKEHKSNGKYDIGIFSLEAGMTIPE